MYEIDPTRLDLAREFKTDPFGVHSAELTAVLTRMRGMPIEGKHCLIVAKPREKWLLARMSGTPLRPRVIPGRVFSSIEEAEWAIFKLRWRILTGHDLAAALDEPETPLAGPIATPDTSRAILAYADRLAVGAGDTVAIKVSSPGIDSYRADVVRLHAPARGTNDAGFRETEIRGLGSLPGRTQPLRIGSYARLPDALALPAAFTIQMLVWPTLYGNPGALMADWSQAEMSGVALLLDAKGAPTLRFGNGEMFEDVTTGVALPLRTWSRIAASFDAATGHVEIVQQPLPGHGFTATRQTVAAGTISIDPVASGRPLLMAAWHVDDEHGAAHAGHFNGKIEAPAIIASALDAAALLALPLAPAELGRRGDVVAAWDLSLDIATDSIRDVAPGQNHGRLLNQPTRAMTGHSWDGSVRDFTALPAHYGAIHFHDDDIDDAGWETDVAIEIDETWPSGVYACRLRSGADETYIPFFVRPGAQKARIAFLAPTATYTVYANNRARFFLPTTELIRGRVLDFDAADLQLLDYPLGLSTYCVHSDGSGVAYGTRLRPVTNFRPKGRLWNFSEDLFVIEWLESFGEAFDVITDDDLHIHGKALLEPYRVVITGTHPEYYTTEMYDAVEDYLGDGGRLVYLGGNGFYWRIAYNPAEPGIIETRRAENGTRAWEAEPGEYYMSFSGEMSGLWRRQGRSPHRLVGVGFSGQGFDRSSYFRRTEGSRDPRAAFVFEGIDGDIIGDFGASGGAAGEELDSCDLRLGSPAHTLVLASSENHSPAYQPANDMVTVPHLGTGAMFNAAVKADMVFFECPNGGAVFSTGSIAYAGALAHNGCDNDIARLTGNVLRRFVDPKPFEMPDS